MSSRWDDGSLASCVEKLALLSHGCVSDETLTLTALPVRGVSETRFFLLPLRGVDDARFELLPLGVIVDTRLDLLPFGGVVDTRLALLPLGNDDDDDKLPLLPCMLLAGLCLTPSNMNSFLDNGSDPGKLPLWLVSLDLVSTSFSARLLNSAEANVLISSESASNAFFKCCSSSPSSNKERSCWLYKRLRN